MSGWVRPLVAFALGLGMALALGLGGMTQPSKVIGFLDFFGHFDPALAFVMGGAVIVNAVGYHLVTKRRAPVFAAAFDVPKRTIIDTRLVLGSALFGVGWGISGFCPGPALVSLGGATLGSVVFVAMMVAGQLAFDALDAAVSSRPRDASAPTNVETSLDG